MPKQVSFQGKCPRCGQIYHSRYRTDVIVCDCWRKCPICGAEMQPYTPDPTTTYTKDGKRELAILMVCNNTSEHPSNSPFYSTQKPVEVELS
ncbi:hypothetical protein KEJ15_09780 [Candidatus Bathyarchaeota archaeon]|nr:hypothetical protein [Candidatus Bathyarchaeota archaeon]